MSTATRISAFAAALVATFAVAFGVGVATQPDETTPAPSAPASPHPANPEHGGDHGH